MLCVSCGLGLPFHTTLLVDVVEIVLLRGSRSCVCNGAELVLKAQLLPRVRSYASVVSAIDRFCNKTVRRMFSLYALYVRTLVNTLFLP